MLAHGAPLTVGALRRLLHRLIGRAAPDRSTHSLAWSTRGVWVQLPVPVPRIGAVRGGWTGQFYASLHTCTTCTYAHIRIHTDVRCTRAHTHTYDHIGTHSHARTYA